MPTKAALDKKTMEELKSALVEKRLNLLQKLNQWEDNSSPSGLKEMGDIADIASQLNDEALSSVLTEVEIDTLRQIEFALEKIENGSYGICEGTKKKIPIARLKAIPWTRYTVEYAEQLSKNRPRSHRSDSLTHFPVPMDMDNLD
ncbi:MAG: TraR/DksA family transcriptional regulator [Leptospiraceae bacterium]|jgi:DnaK suppressor protein|nr:TraR/DksA family transcriptional regulator [Leptospiraceae bacterium]MCZ8237256.1 TraR/DksA family transcriptional regulator [Leptospiraceae bacterium]MCZ8346070.1 TraR/DksA family transcriptional regulator [Leptospiraceae bacterium]PJE02282.1 MAG: molecular chaperone DnaK [Leptospira sp.]